MRTHRAVRDRKEQEKRKRAREREREREREKVILEHTWNPFTKIRHARDMRPLTDKPQGYLAMTVMKNEHNQSFIESRNKGRVASN